MSDGSREAQGRLARFLRRGDDLGRLEPEDRERVLAEARLGLAPVKRGKFVFRCPTCGNRFEYDQELEPLCTGPNAGLDEHEAAVMVNLTVPGLGPPEALDGSSVLYERVGA